MNGIARINDSFKWEILSPCNKLFFASHERKNGTILMPPLLFLGYESWLLVSTLQPFCFVPYFKKRAIHRAPPSQLTSGKVKFRTSSSRSFVLCLFPHSLFAALKT